MTTRDLREDLLRVERDNANLRQEVLTLRQFIDSMQNLIESIEGTHTETEVMGLLEGVLENALTTINAKDGSLLVRDEVSDELVFVLSRGDVPADELAWKRLAPGTGIAGWVAEQRTATIVNNARADDRFYDDVDRDLDFHTNSILAAPILGGNQLLGVIEVLNKRDGKLFNEDDQTLLSLICRFAGELLYSVVRSGDQPATPHSSNTP